MRWAVISLSLCGFVFSCTPAAVQMPAQPTSGSVLSVAAALEPLAPYGPVAVWQVGDYAVRAACHTWLNQAAIQNAQLGQTSAGIGVLGAGASIANPLAGVVASLAQTFLTSLQNTGPVPSTATAILIDHSMDAYESGVSGSYSIPQAMGFVDDLWYKCTPGGAAETTAIAGMTAQFGVTRSAVRPRVIINPPAVAPEHFIPRDYETATRRLRLRPTMRGRWQDHRAKPISAPDDLSERLRWLRSTMTYIRFLDAR